MVIIYNVKILTAFCYYRKYNKALSHCDPHADKNNDHIKIINKHGWL